jgi:hypothetical protein
VSVNPLLAGLVGLPLLATACGSAASHVAQLSSTTNTTQRSPSSTTSIGSAHQHAALAYSRCVRSHGVRSFPDPDPQGQLPSFPTSVPKQISAAADSACKHLLSSGVSVGTPQNRQEKLAFGLKVARCLRSHGFPNFPDPTVSSQGTSQSVGGVNPNSPKFQGAETTCEKQARGRP